MSEQPTPPAHTPGPWKYIPSNESHGPYVVSAWASDICDCYTMSNLSALSVRNGGDSKPIHFQHEHADANARLIAAAPDLLLELRAAERWLSGMHSETDDGIEREMRETHSAAWESIDKMRAAIAKATGAQP